MCLEPGCIVLGYLQGDLICTVILLNFWSLGYQCCAYFKQGYIALFQHTETRGQIIVIFPDWQLKGKGGAVLFSCSKVLSSCWKEQSSFPFLLPPCFYPLLFVRVRGVTAQVGPVNNIHSECSSEAFSIVFP